MITSPKKRAAIAGLRACITFSPLISRRAAQALAVGALLALGLHPAQAQTTYTDSGATLLFSTGFAPAIPVGGTASTDTLLFNNAGASTQTDDLTAAQVLNTLALSFTNAGALTLNAGANNSTIFLNGTAPTITLNNAGALSLNLNLSFANNTTITQSHAATFGGVISGTASTITLNNSVGASSTANALTLTGTNTFGGQWIVASTVGAIGNYANDDLILNSATGPSINGNLQIGNSTGFATGVVATAANQFASTSIVSFKGGASVPDNFSLHFNQTIAGLNDTSGNNAVQINQNSDSAAYGPVTLTLAGTGTYSYGGTIRNTDGGTGSSILSLIKTGTGQQTLTGSTTYTGGTTVSAGTLTFKDSHSGSSNFVDNGTLEFNVTGTNTQNLSGGTISGTGTLLKSGAGTLQIGANGQPQNVSMTGGLIDVEGGLLRNEYGNGVWTNNKASLNVASGATVNLWDSGITVDALTGSGTVTHTDHGGSQNFTVGVNNGSGIFSGTITDVSDGATPGAHPIALVKKGTGTQTLSGAVSSTGANTISAGTLILSGTADNSGFAVNVTGGTLVLGKTSSGTPGVHALGGASTISGGTIQLGGSGGDQIFDGAGLNVNSGTFDLNGKSEGMNFLSGTGGTVLNNATGTTSILTIGTNNGGGTYAGIIADNNAGTGILSLINASGTGTLFLSGTNTYSGGTTVSSGTLALIGTHDAGSGAISVTGGTLSLGNGATNGGNALVAGNGVTLASGATLLLNQTGGSNVTYAAFPITANGNANLTFGTTNTHTSTLNSPITLNNTSGSQFFTIGSTDAQDTVNLQGVISGTGDLKLAPSGNGNPFLVTINQAETYTGNTFLNQTITTSDFPDLKLLSGGSLPSATILTLTQLGTNPSRTETFDLNGFGQTLGGLTAAGASSASAAVINSNNATTSALTINNAAADNYGGLIGSAFAGGTVGAATPNTSNISLTKSGLGTLTLSSNNPYSGGTTVSGGTLALIGTNDAGSGAISVTGGTLSLGNGVTNVTNGGNALVAGNGVTLANNTTLSFNQFQGSNVTYAAFPITANGNATLMIAGGNTTTSNIASPITIGTSGTPTLTINETEAQATVNLTGVISGTGNLAITSSGSANGNPLAITINKAETYLGSTTLTQTGGFDYPQLQLLAGGSLPATTILNLSSSAFQPRNVSLDLNGQAQTLAGLVSGGSAPSHDVVFNSSTTASTLTVNPTGNDFFGGVIGGTGPNNNNLGLTVGGTGTLQLSGQNTYTGPTNVTNGGALDLFITTQTAIAGTSNVNISTGGTVVIDNHGGGGQLPYANQFTLNGNGGGTYAGKGALETFNSGNFSFSGPIILQTDSSIGINPDAQGAVTVSGVISGAGSLTLIGESATDTGYPANTTAPTVLLTNTNTYTGVNTLLTSNNNGTTAGNVFGVTLGGGSGQTNILPSTTQLIFGGTPAGAAGTYNQNVTVTLNNDNQSVAGVSSTGTGAYTIIGGNSAQSTLTVTPTGTSTFNGVIGGTGTNNNNLALTKSGAGTQVLTGTNTYTGATTITAGTLQVGSGGAAPTGSIASSSVAVGGGATLITASNGALNSSATAVNLGDGNGNATVQNGAFTGATAANNIQKAGALSLGLGTADILDFAGKFGTFDFASAAGSGFSLVGTSLNVRNFGTATNESTLGGNYQLLFDTALTTAQLGDISFLNSDSSQFGAIQQFVSGTSGQVQILEGTASAPEPAQTAALGLFGLGLGALVLKARKRSSVAAG